MIIIINNPSKLQKVRLPSEHNMIQQLRLTNYYFQGKWRLRRRTSENGMIPLCLVVILLIPACILFKTTTTTIEIPCHFVTAYITPALPYPDFRLSRTNRIQKPTFLPIKSRSLQSNQSPNIWGDSNPNKDNDDPEDTNKRGQRRRDKFIDWIYGNDSKKNMVRPIGLDGRIVEEYDDDDEDNSSNSDATTDSSTAKGRVKAAFGNLFAGMPSLSEILFADDEDPNVKAQQQLQQQQVPNTEQQSSSQRSGRGSSRVQRRRQQPEDDTWFENDRQKIIQNYNDIYASMMNQVETQRQRSTGSDDSSTAVPANAEALIRSVLKQEMEKEIKETKDQLARDRLDDYERDLKEQLEIEEKDPSQQQQVISNDEKLKQLIQETEKEYQTQQKSQLDLEEFLRYEREAKIRNTNDDEAFNRQFASSVPSSSSDFDLDQWVLDRFQEMVEKNENKNGGEIVLDNLEENLQELISRIQEKLNPDASKGLDFDNLKEWQMYRSIATRLAESSSSTQGSAEDDTKIRQLLQSWKEYISKEEAIRKKSGLSSLGPKLPFAWQEAELEDRLQQRSTITMKSATATLENDNNDNNNSNRPKIIKSAIEVRKEMNKMAIDAMESLLRSPTIDAQRRANLEKELGYLKSTLEKNDYLDIDNIPEDYDRPEKIQPIDTSNLFKPYTLDDDEYFEDEMSSILSDYDDADFSTSAPKIATPQPPTDNNPTESQSKVAPPNTPFFASSPMDGDDVEQPRRKTLPPNTPFFNDFSAELDNDDDDESKYTDSKLGSMEDQKLEAMYRRAGARTASERAAIKMQYVEFKAIEQVKREESGLAARGEGETTGLDPTSLGYNVADVMKEDGDFDASKVLAAIGPRPKRKKKSSVSEEASEKPDFDTDIMKSKIQKEEIMESRYRAISAIGGGRYKDNPDEKAKQQTAFEEFMEKENKLREALDNTEELSGEMLADVELPDASLLAVDDVKYAEEVIASLGARPKPKRARVVQDERTLSDLGGDDDDDDDLDDEPEAEVSMIPEWLRKEQDEAKQQQKNSGSSKRKSFLGNDIDDAFDDRDYEKNMRQLAEYERRRAGEQGKRGSLGIDISDVLGPRRSSLYQSDDYADYKYDDNADSRRQRKQDDWIAGSFDKRKRDMLDYVELDLQVVNALMDHKDSVYSTGVSQYLSRINKPFKEFGAIFRLEGVLVDITGLAFEAFTKVAKDFNFKAPTLEEARQGAVVRPEVAVKDIFFWSDNVIECKQVAAAYQDAMRQSFAVWKEENGIADAEVDSEFQSNEFSKSENAKEKVQPIRSSPKIISESEKVEIMAKAWARTAESLGFPKPLRDDIVAAILLTPDIAIKRVFQWSSDPVEIDDIAQVYRFNARTLYEGSSNEQPPTSTIASSQKERRFTKSVLGGRIPWTQNDIMELHHQAWTAVAKAYNFEAPLPDESVAAFVLNDPQTAVQKGFGWADDALTVSNVVNDFQFVLSKLRDGTFTEGSVLRPGDGNKAYERPVNDIVQSSLDGPSPDEIYQLSKTAWLSTATKLGQSAPDDEQIQFALSVGPEEAVVNGFQWASSATEVDKIISIYKAEIAKGRAKWKGGTTQQARLTPTIPKPTTSIGPTADELFMVVFESWSAIAMKAGYPVPDHEQVQFALSVGPEEAIVNGFQWSEDKSKVNELVESYRQELAKRKSKWQKGGVTTKSTKQGKETPKVVLKPGVSDWIKSLLQNEMQCGVVSYLDRNQVDTLLTYAGLDKLIPPDKRVSATNKYATDDDQLLGVALRLERRPDHCALFDTTPYASVAAHNVEMQSVNIIGPYPRYELLTADATTALCSDLTAMNIRRLFGERVYDQPLQEAQQVLQRNTRTKIFVDEDDF